MVRESAAARSKVVYGGSQLDLDRHLKSPDMVRPHHISSATNLYTLAMVGSASKQSHLNITQRLPKPISVGMSPFTLNENTKNLKSLINLDKHQRYSALGFRTPNAEENYFEDEEEGEGEKIDQNMNVSSCLRK